MRASPLLLAYGTNAPLVEAQLFNSIKSKVLAVGCRKLLLEKCALNKSAKLKGGQKHGRFKTQWPQRLGFCRKKALNCEQQNKQVFVAGHKAMVGSELVRLLSTKLADQPRAESAFLTGNLEPTNEPYAIAKIASIKLCESYNRQHGRDYRSVMPTNLCGPGDNFHTENSHVNPALMRRIHEAKLRGDAEVVIWGSGKPMREFLHVDDMAAASVHVMNLAPAVWQAHTQPTMSHINVGTGVDCTIRELAQTMAKVTGYTGRTVFDINKPDGAPRKLLNIRLMKILGYTPAINLNLGLKDTYSWYINHNENSQLIKI